MKCKRCIISLIGRFNDDDILALAAELAYNLIISFFPFLIFLMTLIGFSSLRGVDVLVEMKKMLPLSAYELVSSTVLEVVDTRNGNLMSFGIIFTIWTASSGFRAVIKGINKAYDEPEERSFLKLVIISVISTFVLVIMIMLLMILLVFGEIIGNKLITFFGFTKFFNFMWNILRYVILFLALVLMLSGMYRYIPCRKLKWREVLPGALVASIGWAISSFGFAYYVNNFGNYSKIYGSIGAVFVLLTWIYLISIIILVGGEINAVLAFDREGKIKPKCKKF